jgi:hypothetical protein
MRLLLAALLLTLAHACDCGQGGPCDDDADCDPEGQGYRGCELESGLCICIDDRGCGDGEFCNAAGSCQAIAGCATNDDCGNSLFCDVTSSRCLSLTECGGEDCCTIDSQCAYTFVCEPITKACIEGCRDDGDCLLGQGCVGGGLGRLGLCGTACTNDTLCDPGEICNLDTGVCEKDVRGPYCLSCAGGVGSDDCGEPGNYCLVDTTIATNPPTEFCGVDCWNGEACPNGYECSDVIIVPPSAPLCGAEACVGDVCTTSGGGCTVSEDCPFGPPQGNCVEERGGRAGNCDTPPYTPCSQDSECDGTCILTECRGGEGDVLGSCSCTTNSDCPVDDCVGGDPQTNTRGHCRLSGHDCFQNFECEVITCVEGGCLIGSNCAPSNDRSCADLLPEAEAP